MKYHATISTIVISIIVVLIFFFVASFTVFSLQILSPGYMISDYLLKKIPSLEPYTIKYDSLDSSFKDGININNVEIKYKDISLVQTDKIKISTSIYSLLKGYFSKQVTLDIAFLNLNINLPFDYKELVLPSLSSGNAEGEEKEPIKPQSQEPHYKVVGDQILMLDAEGNVLGVSSSQVEQRKCIGNNKK